jgi:hypothetical protein
MQDLQRLLEAADPVIKRVSESVELGLVPARANTQDQPAAGDLLDGVRDLGQECRIAERRADDECPQLGLAGDGCERRKLRHALPRAPGLGVRRTVNQVVGNPDGIDADRFADLRHLPRIGPARGLAVELPLMIWQQQPDLQRPRPLCL